MTESGFCGSALWPGTKVRVKFLHQLPFEMAQPPTCPWCSAHVRRPFVELGTPFPCPSCGANVQIRRIWLTNIKIAGSVLGFGAAYLFGAGSLLPHVGFLLALVSQLLLTDIALSVAPPVLEMGDGPMNVR